MKEHQGADGFTTRSERILLTRSYDRRADIIPTVGSAISFTTVEMIL